MVEQYVMAYGVEHDRLRAILPKGFTSLRPVLRINAEIVDNETGYLEFNTAVEKDSFRGWLNINFMPINYFKTDNTVTFRNELIEITFTRVGIKGSCPAEKDNDGCIFLSSGTVSPPDNILSEKEFCECKFSWANGTGGESMGKTLPAIPTEERIIYPKLDFNLKNAASIACKQVLGAYAVEFERR